MTLEMVLGVPAHVGEACAPGDAGEVMEGPLVGLVIVESVVLVGHVGVDLLGRRPAVERRPVATDRIGRNADALE